MNNEIDNKKLTCGFCGESKTFSKVQQVPLRIDKNAKFQMLFDFRCNECGDKNKRTNLNDQHMRQFTGRSRSTDEQTVFGDEDQTLL